MKDSDFKITKNPSIQNGGIMLYSHCSNLLNPVAGIGMQELIGGNMTKVAYELNRWQTMAKNDGASIARWAAAPYGGNEVAITTEVSYE